MTGKIVKSKAGHDKGCLYVISGVSDIQKKTVLIVDGKTRRIEKPKKKNLKHLIFTEYSMPSGENLTDKKIREQIKMFRPDFY